MSTSEDERAPLAGARPTVADVPATGPDGAPVLVRAVLRYTAPGLELATLEDPGTVATVARRLRVAVEGAGYVWPVRRVVVGAWSTGEPGAGVRRHRATSEPAGGWLPWWPGWELPAAVAVVVAAGQLGAGDVPGRPIAGEVTGPGALVACGCRRVQPRRRVRWDSVQRGLREWDRGTVALVSADHAAARARAVRIAGLATMRDAGMTLAAIAAATGLTEDRVSELLRTLENGST